ncbi:MAG: HD domain-containing protein [Chloroflexi bacterium]|nr:HD domain-containing protein [Chloroflexota bacterium]
MDRGLVSLLDGVALIGAMREDMIAFLRRHECLHTVGHCLRVAAEAKTLALCFDADPAGAEIAGWLHDISVVIPNDQRVALAEQLGLAILPEERQLPMILHQKLSAIFARDLFGIHDPAILNAIGCHTTLRPAASRLDKVVFLADKIAWDQPGQPPYLAEVNVGLQCSLDQAVFGYVDWLWRRRETLPVVHPWLAAAYAELSGGSHRAGWDERFQAMSAAGDDRLLDPESGSLTRWDANDWEWS